MRTYRIAVCLSGQCRTWETAMPNIRQFFDIDRVTFLDEEHTVEVDYFFHTWDSNTWWRGDKWANHPEKMPDDELARLANAFDAKSFIIEPQRGSIFGRQWDNMFYSLMRSMHLKSAYEIEHGFEYDQVVKARFDIIYPPGLKFPARPVEPLVAYTSAPISKFAGEYLWNDFHDVIFWGDSPTMSMVGDLHRWYQRICNPGKKPNYQYTPDCPDCQNSGPGTLLYRYLVRSGILPRVNGSTLENWPFIYTVLREQAVKEGLDLTADYKRIHEIYMSMY